MKMFEKRQFVLTVGVIAAAAIGNLSAATLNDASLVSPGAGAPGWYDGASPTNPNGGFTITDEGTIELGLRAKLRQDPSIIDPVGDVYTVPTGTEQSTPDHAANPNRAAWNFEYSIDLGPNGSGLRLSDITSTLTVTDHTGTFTFSDFGDNAEFGTAGIVNESTGPDPSTLWGTQNSENPLFFRSFFTDINTPDTYTFDLTVKNLAGTTLATDEIVVSSVAPEPATFSLIGLGLAGFAAFARKRRKNLV